MLQKDILNKIVIERNRQDDKWGLQNHEIYKWLAILGEEVGEANKAALEQDLNGLLDELVQVAAVSVAMIESIKRNMKD